ncbi:P-loop containing nucleoside triphosphate hydrolase protein [Athelia psychrophila]|uniref:P-loop containing nucleoside triphosphate hydrolase protein n=1 Tax=Athelia psychrophila TaxID=1759441 RepID=A0A165WMI2_9AGAM|nr:P-loop containing nucleoside triphosphate hydrolase protein [Fibularhizoctonia sp. CBS 109695]
MHRNEISTPRTGSRSLPAKSSSKTNVLDTLNVDIVIAVMGATGSGKTTFINLLSGSELRVGRGLQSCTSVVQAAAPFTFQGRRVLLFDTPGFDDTTKSDTDILKMIAAFLASTYEQGATLSGVIYMHRISDFRMGGISRRNFSMFRKLCGDDSLKNVALVTNMWSEVDPAPVLDKHAQLLRHDGTLATAQAIVAQIVDNHPMALRIQEELVDEHKDISETAAGTELNRELAEQARKHKEELKLIREEMQVAIKERDEETRQELEAEAKKLKAEMQRVQTDSQKLAANYNEEKARLEQRMMEISDAAQRSAAGYQRQMEELQRALEERTHTSAAERNAIQKQMDDLQRKYEADVRHNGGGCIIV